MNLGIANERLSQLIGRFGAASMETSQVAKRLHALLPTRFMELKREHARRARGGKADRLALTDQRFLQHVDEYVQMFGEAMDARIQYETHAMLFKARQSLRAFNRR